MVGKASSYIYVRTLSDYFLSKKKWNILIYIKLIIPETEQTGTGDFIYTATTQQIVEWSFQETKVFYEQVKKHGYGNWNIIKEELNTSRTVDQLKERWKTMIKDESLMQEFNFGMTLNSTVVPIHKAQFECCPFNVYCSN